MIYCIHAVGTEFVKIGVVNSIKDRLAMLQIGCPLELVLIASTDWPDVDERIIHRHLCQDNVRGEWFRMSDATNAVIDAIRTGIRQNIMDLYAARSDHPRLAAVLDYCSAISAAQHNLSVVNHI